MEESQEPSVINGDDLNKKPENTLDGVLHRMVSTIFISDPGKSTPLVERIKIASSENLPLLKEASRNTGKKVIHWTRKGSALRALLVISVGSIIFLTLTGFLVFMLFFLAATANAIIISLLVSLAAAGGFLAFFFACVTVVYVGALSVAIFVISTATISAIIAVLIATGWIGFLWTVWLVTKKSMGMAKHSLTVTGSAISAYSSTRHAHHHHKSGGVSN